MLQCKGMNKICSICAYIYKEVQDKIKPNRRIKSRQFTAVTAYADSGCEANWVGRDAQAQKARL